MRILDTYTKQTEPTAARAAAPVARPDAAATPKDQGAPTTERTPAVRVTISARARALAAQAEAPHDPARIEALRSAVASDTLAVDAAAIAAKIVQGA